MKTWGPGEPILNTAAFDFVKRTKQLIWVKNWNKAVSPVVLANMQYRTVINFIEQGQLSLALKLNKEE